MTRFRQMSDILRLMSNKEQIRNLGIVAHVDHGKTTLADSLLAGAGLLSPTVAGSVRVLDYLREEQKRGITMKSANISMLHKTLGHPVLLNLVDTPGHIDFMGKVTRAFRAIDGAVVVVDAVEGIMIQTEILLRQALAERVCPVLFINKVDRLITELKLDSKQIEERFKRIINDFNKILEIHGEFPFKHSWKADATSGNVGLGSALHRWGFTLSTMQQKGMKFREVMGAYKNSEYKNLHKVLPLHNAILEMVVKTTPSPLVAQKYRVPRIWKGDLNSEIGQAMVNCDDKGPAVMCITNVKKDPKTGTISTGRLFSGTINEGAKVHLLNAGKDFVSEGVFVYMGAFREPVIQVPAGNIAAIMGLELAKPGETLVTADQKEGMLPFEPIKYFSEPVITVAIEPSDPRKIPFLLKVMKQLELEDPNLRVTINRETGEYLLSGMGELHLETSLNTLRESSSDSEIFTSSPRVVFRESVSRKGIIATAKSPNCQNTFVLKVEPAVKSSIPSSELVEIAGKTDSAIAFDENNNALVDLTGNTESFRVAIDSVIAGFKFAAKAGPLCGEPMTNIKVSLIAIQLHEKLEYRNSEEVKRGVGKAVFGSFLSAVPFLLEPIYQMEISVPTELVGECSKILIGRRGRIFALTQKQGLALITGYIPVRETLGISNELRSATSGRAFWQFIFSHWEKVPEDLSAGFVREVRKRRGLPNGIPQPSKFLESN